MKLKFNNNEFCIIGDYNISNSLREVKYSDVIIDMTGLTISDLPIKYQEIQFVENNQVKFFGYISEIKLPTYDRLGQRTVVEIELLSPYAMAINRVVTLTGNYNLNEFPNVLFGKLISDGFFIAENELPSRTLNVTYIFETIENVMNKICNTYKMFWYIDESKGINIKSIESLSIPKHTIETCNDLIITPKIKSVDYANVINIKDVKVYTRIYDTGDLENDMNVARIMTVPQEIKDGTVIKLAYPIDISLTGSKKVSDQNGFFARNLRLFDEFGTEKYYVRYNNLNIVLSDNVGYANQDENNPTITLLLERDSFFKNLIVGLTFRNIDPFYLGIVESDTVLKNHVLTYTDLKEIENNKGKISPSGIIERTISLNDRWFLIEELVDFAKTQITLNNNQTDEVQLKYKTNDLVDIKIGDLVRINRPEQFTVGNFIVTDINKNMSPTTVSEQIFILRNSNYIENFIDIYRKNEEETDDQLNAQIVSLYIKDELIENKIYNANGEAIT